MKKLSLLAVFLIVFLLEFSCSRKDEFSYADQWNRFETKLTKRTKSFQSYEQFEPKLGDIQLVTFRSDSLELQGLLNTKNIDSLVKKPVIVYFHGGFALSYEAMERTKAFTDAGYIVFAPSYRGENGNSGYFELFMGEVKDAKAAINWISKQQFTDADNIYVFGWSVGGGIALNLALHDDTPVKLGGSNAGIYDLELINSWATEDDYIVFPYDHNDELENYFRLPLYNLENMARPHFTYVGEEDDFDLIRAEYDSLYPEGNTKLKLTKVKGDHVSSLSIAIDKFIREIHAAEK